MDYSYQWPTPPIRHDSPLENYTGWSRLCATDCNGVFQNIDDPCRCFLNVGPHRPNEGRSASKKAEPKKSNYSREPSSSKEWTIAEILQKFNAEYLANGATEFLAPQKSVAPQFQAAPYCVGAESPTAQKYGASRFQATQNCVGAESPTAQKYGPSRFQATQNYVAEYLPVQKYGASRHQATRNSVAAESQVGQKYGVAECQAEQKSSASYFWSPELISPGSTKEVISCSPFISKAYDYWPPLNSKTNLNSPSRSSPNTPPNSKTNCFDTPSRNIPNTPNSKIDYLNSPVKINSPKDPSITPDNVKKDADTSLTRLVDEVLNTQQRDLETLRKRYEECYKQQDESEEQETNSCNGMIEKPGTSVKSVSPELTLFAERCSPDTIIDEHEVPEQQFFKLFPEKSSSAPSLLNGLASYLREISPPRRPRCQSDPHSQTNGLSNYKQLLSDSNLKGRTRMTSLTEMSNPKLDSADNGEESSLLPDLFKTKTSVSDSPSPTCEVWGSKTGSTLSSPSPSQNHLLELLSSNKNIDTKANLETELRDPHAVVNMLQNRIVPFQQPEEYYTFQLKILKSCEASVFKQPAVYCCIKAGRITYEWKNPLPPLESLNIREDSVWKKPEIDSVPEQLKKKNFKKPTSPQAQVMECKFCKSNMETQKIYKSHNLKQRIGKRTFVTCPILRKLVCTKCGETGDNAHTLSYCPLAIAESGRKPLSVATELKKTKRVASGKPRRGIY